MTKTVLITGGAGFIGSHCADRLLAKGDRVIALDNVFSGKQENIKHLLGVRGFAFVEGDITDEPTVAKILRDECITHVLHLAGLHFIPYCVSHPEETHRVNVEGTGTVLRAADGVQLRAFVLASTAAVYAPADAPHAETALLGPIDVYGQSKMEAEALLGKAAIRHPDCAFVAARLFNVYGLRETNPHVIPDLISQLRSLGKVRPGNVWPRRDYVYVEDVAEVLTQVLEWDGPPLVVNVGTGQGSSVADLINVLSALLDRSISVEQDPSKVRPEDRPCLIADCRRALEVLGWQARYDLREGLRRLLDAEGLLPVAKARERIGR